MAEPESNAPKLLVSTAVMGTTSLVFMLLRFGCKFRYGKRFAPDDYILGLSWIFLATYMGVIIPSTRYGIGRHVAELSHDDVTTAHRLLGIADFFAIISISTAKSSFAVTLLRLTQETWHKVVIWLILVTVNVGMWLCAIFVFVSCTPTAKTWDPLIEGTCWDLSVLKKVLTFNVYAGSWSAATDIILALFPWLLLWGVNLKKIEKVGVCVAMSFGILSGITAAFKTSYIEQSARWKDWTYLSVDLLAWSTAETAVVIIASSIPFLRLALKEVSNASTSGPGSRSYRLDHISAFKEDTSSKRIGNHVTVEASHRKLDDMSDRSILREAKLEDGSIVRTHDVTFYYHDEGDAENQRPKAEFAGV